MMTHDALLRRALGQVSVVDGTGVPSESECSLCANGAPNEGHHKAGWLQCTCFCHAARESLKREPGGAAAMVSPQAAPHTHVCAVKDPPLHPVWPESRDCRCAEPDRPQCCAGHKLASRTREAPLLAPQMDTAPRMSEPRPMLVQMSEAPAESEIALIQAQYESHLTLHPDHQSGESVICSAFGCRAMGALLAALKGSEAGQRPERQDLLLSTANRTAGVAHACREALRAYPRGMTPSQLAEHTGLMRIQVVRSLTQMRKTGKVRDRGGVWRLTGQDIHQPVPGEALATESVADIQPIEAPDLVTGA